MYLLSSPTLYRLTHLSPRLDILQLEVFPLEKDRLLKENLLLSLLVFPVDGGTSAVGGLDCNTGMTSPVSDTVTQELEEG